MMVTVILTGVAYVAFYQCVENSLALRQSADDISNALRAGEQWRADMRASNGQLRVEGYSFVLPITTGNVNYQFTTNAVLRQVGSGPWICVLEKVKSSTFAFDGRFGVSSWRWELELRPRFKKQGRLRPLFTFIAVGDRY
jgi:hypothetical protein